MIPKKIVLLFALSLVQICRGSVGDSVNIPVNELNGNQGQSVIIISRSFGLRHYCYHQREYSLYNFIRQWIEDWN